VNTTVLQEVIEFLLDSAPDRRSRWRSNIVRSLPSPSRLAGLVVERLSGVRYETYMADRVFGPLRMMATTAHQPPEARLANDLARGYRWVDDHHEALP